MGENNNANFGAGIAKVKVGISDKAKWIEQLHAVDKKVSILEKERDTRLFGNSSSTPLPPDLQDLKDFQTELILNLQSEENILFSQIKKIRSALSKLKLHVDHIEGGRGTKASNHLSTLEGLMNFMESEITSFKDQQRAQYEEMSREEKSLTREISVFEKRMEEWADENSEDSNAVATDYVHTKPIKSEPREALPPEVLAFQSFLEENGGETGGWDSKDHQQFVNLRNITLFGKNASEDPTPTQWRAFYERASREIPTQNRNTVVMHERFYSMYLALLDAKKQAVQRWKEHKEAQKALKVAQEDVEILKVNLESEEMRKKARDEEIKQKEMVREWKEKKKKEEEEKIQEKKRMEVQIIQEAKEREEKRKAKLKEQVEKYRQEKQEEEERRRIMEQEEREREERYKPAVSALELERLHERDKMMIANRQLKSQQKEMLQAEKEERLQKLRNQVHINVERDPSRITQSTFVTKHRSEPEDVETKKAKLVAAGQSQVRVMSFPSRRATPTWRVGL